MTDDGLEWSLLMLFVPAKGKGSISGSPVGTVRFDWEWSGAGFSNRKECRVLRTFNALQILGDLFKLLLLPPAADGSLSAGGRGSS